MDTKGEAAMARIDLSEVPKPTKELDTLTWRTKFAVVIVHPDGTINVMARNNTSGDEKNAEELAAVLLIAGGYSRAFKERNERWK